MGQPARPLKAFYAWGLRRQEMTGLDLADPRRNPKLPGFGRHGAVFVRYGKSSSRSPPKRRTVFTVPETDWLPGVLGQSPDTRGALADVTEIPHCAGV